MLAGWAVQGCLRFIFVFVFRSLTRHPRPACRQHKVYKADLYAINETLFMLRRAQKLERCEVGQSQTANIFKITSGTQRKKNTKLKVPDGKLLGKTVVVAEKRFFFIFLRIKLTMWILLVLLLVCV